MEISKENIFKVGYSSSLQKKKEKTSNLKKFVKENKIISISIVIFFICVVTNLTLIYNFMRILQHV